MAKEMEVLFTVNGRPLAFDLEADLAQILLTDDLRAIEYLRSCALSGSLVKAGILPEHADTLEIIRGHIEDYINLSGPTQQTDAVLENDQTENLSCNNMSQERMNSSNVKFSKELTARLLECRGCRKYVKLFNDKKTNKRQLWNKIAEELQIEGFDLGTNKEPGEKCRQKFANLQKGYVAYLGNMKQTGAGAIDKPWYFDLIDIILGDKHKIRPPLIIDSEDCNKIEKLFSANQNQKNSQLALTPDKIPGPSGIEVKNTSSFPVSPSTASLLGDTNSNNSTPKGKNRFEQSRLNSKSQQKTAVQVLQDIHVTTQKALEENKNMIQSYLNKQVEHQQKDDEFKASLLKILASCLKSSKQKRKREASFSEE